jgi:hypothetical protein
MSKYESKRADDILEDEQDIMLKQWEKELKTLRKSI